MGSLPVLKPREVIKLLEKLGFTLVRQRGSHCQFRHPDGRGTTVPDHKGQDISYPSDKPRTADGIRLSAIARCATPATGLTADGESVILI